jgi:hypothetical protein
MTGSDDHRQDGKAEHMDRNTLHAFPSSRDIAATIGRRNALLILVADDTRPSQPTSRSRPGALALIMPICVSGRRGPVLSAPDRRRIRSRRPRTGTRRMRRCSHEDPTLGGPNRSGHHLGRPICRPATGPLFRGNLYHTRQVMRKVLESLANPKVPLPLPQLRAPPARLARGLDLRTDCPETTSVPKLHSGTLVLTTTAWPLRASRDTPALLARLV